MRQRQCIYIPHWMTKYIHEHTILHAQYVSILVWQLSRCSTRYSLCVFIRMKDESTPLLTSLIIACKRVYLLLLHSTLILNWLSFLTFKIDIQCVLTSKHDLWVISVFFMSGRYFDSSKGKVEGQIFWFCGY